MYQAINVGLPYWLIQAVLWKKIIIFVINHQLKNGCNENSNMRLHWTRICDINPSILQACGGKLTAGKTGFKSNIIQTFLLMMRLLSQSVISTSCSISSSFTFKLEFCWKYFLQLSLICEQQFTHCTGVIYHTQVTRARRLQTFNTLSWKYEVQLLMPVKCIRDVVDWFSHSAEIWWVKQVMNSFSAARFRFNCGGQVVVAPSLVMLCRDKQFVLDSSAHDSLWVARSWGAFTYYHISLITSHSPALIISDWRHPDLILSCHS